MKTEASSVVPESPPELPDRVRQDFIGDKSAFPDVPDDAFLVDDFPGALGEVHEDLHRFGLEPDRLLRIGIAEDLVERRLDAPVADTEALERIHRVLS